MIENQKKLNDTRQTGMIENQKKSKDVRQTGKFLQIIDVHLSQCGLLVPLVLLSLSVSRQTENASCDPERENRSVCC